MTTPRTGRLLEDGLRRVLIQGVRPEIDGGRYPIKRIVGGEVMVECGLIADGHDAVAGVMRYRRPGGGVWSEIRLEAVGNDRFRAPFAVDALGEWEYTVEGWIDAFTTWRSGIEKKIAAGQDVAVELLVGAKLLTQAATRASGTDAEALKRAGTLLADTTAKQDARARAATAPALAALMAAYPDRTHATRYERTLGVVVDPPRAGFSAWYEMFPRSCGSPGKHGTFRDCEARLPYVAKMGFDVLYLPPIHPIGRAFRKGPNNTLEARGDDPGSPWAIGAAEGGHKSVHPQLGTLEDFRRLVLKARALGIEVALDIAFQASPDHPYVKEHPEWFLTRPDGTIQYAENPPKKYQDVYPFDFEGAAWRSLWDELTSVFLFWVEQGVTIFRVDNPHTKSLRFWEYCISEVKARHPEAIFLAEAFTRPMLMYSLAKEGFTQSYTYFTWRHTKAEFTEYMRELTRTDVAEYFRPNFWPNTPDILPEHLQFGGRPAFTLRLVLAATLSSNYGIYGPPFELMEHVARKGAEEYVDNEKFQLRSWDIDSPDSLRDLITRVNRIRRENAALHETRNIAFHETDDEHILCFSKRARDGENVVLVVANMDVHRAHAGTVTLDLRELGIAADETFQAHELISDSRYHWQGAAARVDLDPEVMPVAIYRLRRKLRREQDFEYFL